MELKQQIQIIMAVYWLGIFLLANYFIEKKQYDEKKEWPKYTFLLCNIIALSVILMQYMMKFSSE